MPYQPELITLGEGNTPLQEVEGIYFKSEYKNPTGSHKDRGFAYQISELKKQGIKKAVISSSGNAAISAAYYCQAAGVELTVFISPNINKKKLVVLGSLPYQIITTHKPLSDSVKFARDNNAYNLRQSTDPNAILGYKKIAEEIIREGILPDAVFIPVSSGTTLVGIHLGFEEAKVKTAIHAVQTDCIHPIASNFDKDFQKSSEKSLADAIVARYTPRESEVINIIRKTKGSGWVVTNEEMRKAREWLLVHDLSCSYEGAATLVALWKAKKKGYEFKIPVCLLTGKYYNSP